MSDKQSLQRYYNLFRSVSPEKVKLTDESREIFLNTGFKGTDEELMDSVRFVAKIAHNATFDQFADYILTGENPPMKLSPKEMQSAMGGRALAKAASGRVSVSASGEGSCEGKTRYTNHC